LFFVCFYFFCGFLLVRFSVVSGFLGVIFER